MLVLVLYLLLLVLLFLLSVFDLVVAVAVVLVLVVVVMVLILVFVLVLCVRWAVWLGIATANCSPAVAVSSSRKTSCLRGLNRRIRPYMSPMGHAACSSVSAPNEGPAAWPRCPACAIKSASSR